MIFSGLKLNPLLAQNNCSLIIIFIMTYVSNKMQERERKRKENCYLNKERNAGHFVVQIFILQEYFLYSLNFIFCWKEERRKNILQKFFYFHSGDVLTSINFNRILSNIYFSRLLPLKCIHIMRIHVLFLYREIFFV